MIYLHENRRKFNSKNVLDTLIALPKGEDWYERGLIGSSSKTLSSMLKFLLSNVNALARASNEERRTVKGLLIKVDVNVLERDRSSPNASDTDDKVALYDA